MKKTIKIIGTIGFLFLTSNIRISSAADISTAVKQDDANKLQVLICGSSTTIPIPLQMTAEGYAKTYNTNEGASVGTTTSNSFVWDGTTWQKMKGNTAGYAYTKTDITSKAHPLDGIPSYGTITVATATNYMLIPPVIGQTIKIYGLRVYNLTTTAASVKFYFDSAGTQLAYPSAVGGVIGAGFIDDMYLSKADGGFYLTTTITSLGIVIWYLQE